MGFQCERQGYTVRVDGLRLGDSGFVIQAAIEYDPLLPDDEKDRLAPIARLETLLAIEGETERGKRLGARTMRVGVVGDEALYRFFRRPPRSRPASRPIKGRRSRVSVPHRST